MRLRDDVFLKSIKLLRLDRHAKLSAISGTMSTGYESPIFNEPIPWRKMYETSEINFDRNDNRVSIIEARNQFAVVSSLKFKNKNGGLIDEWPKNYRDQYHEKLELSDNMELIGFYGIIYEEEL